MTTCFIDKGGLLNDNGLPVRTVVAEGKVTANQMVIDLGDDGLIPEGWHLRHASHEWVVETTNEYGIREFRPAGSREIGAKFITIGVFTRRPA